MRNPASFRRFVLPFVGCLAVLAAPTMAQNAAPKPDAKPAEEATPDLVNPDRPGLADGSQVIGPRRFQIEFGYQNEFRSDSGVGQRTMFFPTLLRFGVNDRLEARIETNFFTTTRMTDPANGVSRTDGFAPTSFGFKYHFQDQKAVGKKASLGAIFRLFPGSGSSDFRTNHATADLRLVADWDFTPNLSLNPNVGIGFYEDGSGSTFTTGLVAMTLNYFDKTRKINPFIDFGLQAPEQRGGKSSLIIDAGIAWIVHRNIQLDFSVGQGVLGNTPPHPFLSTGVSVRF